MADSPSGATQEPCSGDALEDLRPYAACLLPLVRSDLDGLRTAARFYERQAAQEPRYAQVALKRRWQTEGCEALVAFLEVIIPDPETCDPEREAPPAATTPPGSKMNQKEAA